MRSVELFKTLSQMCNERIAFQKMLAFQLVSLDPEVSLRFEFHKTLIGHPAHNRLHGGVISSALDSVAGLSLMKAIADKFHDESISNIMLHRFSKLGTIDLRVDFVRQGVGAHFLASATVTRLGGKVGFCQMKLVNDQDLLIATGAASFIVS